MARIDHHLKKEPPHDRVRVDWPLRPVSAESFQERIAVELGNVRGQLLSVSATTEAAAQRDLAAGVRALREQVGAVADGMSEVLSETDQLSRSA